MLEKWASSEGRIQETFIRYPQIPVHECVVHDDVIKWKHFPRYWPFVRGIHRSQVNSPHIGQWRGVLMFSLNCAWLNAWVNNHEAGDLRRNRTHYDVILMCVDIDDVSVTFTSWWLDLSFTEVISSSKRLHVTIEPITALIVWPTWGLPRPPGPRWAPCWPHEPCYLGIS